MTLAISAPVTGSVVPLSAVPDPVFAEAIVGPGTAIDPGDAVTVTALAPISGTLTSLKPHAFVIAAETGEGVLVHLGIDTVDLSGDGFSLRVEAGAKVRIGDPLITWDTAPAHAAGKSTAVPVVVLEAEPNALSVTEADTVTAGEPLLELS